MWDILGGGAGQEGKGGRENKMFLFIPAHTFSMFISNYTFYNCILVSISIYNCIIQYKFFKIK